jgi:hypothetical protein
LSLQKKATDYLREYGNNYQVDAPAVVQSDNATEPYPDHRQAALRNVRVVVLRCAVQNRVKAVGRAAAAELTGAALADVQVTFPAHLGINPFVTLEQQLLSMTGKLV